MMGKVFCSNSFFVALFSACVSASSNAEVITAEPPSILSNFVQGSDYRVLEGTQLSKIKGHAVAIAVDNNVAVDVQHRPGGGAVIVISRAHAWALARGEVATSEANAVADAQASEYGGVGDALALANAEASGSANSSARTRTWTYTRVMITPNSR
jgi:hypothetical protein